MGAWLKRILLGLTAVFLAMLILAAVVLFLPAAFRAGLRIANSHLPVKVEVEGYRHVPGRLGLSGVRIATPQGAFCELTGLEIEYRPFAFLLGRVELSALRLQGPRVTIERSADGRLNLPAASDEPSEEPAGGIPSWVHLLAPLRIREILVTQGHVRFEDLGSGRSFALDPVEIEGAFRGLPLEGEVRLAEGLFRLAQEGLPPLEGRTEAQMSLKGGDVHLGRLLMSLEDAHVLLSGSYAIEDQGYGLEARLESFPLGRVLASLGIEGVDIEALSGQIKAQAAAGKDALLTADLRGPVFGQPIQARLGGGLSEEGIRLESVEIETPEATVQGKADWRFADDGLSAGFRLEAPVLEDFFRPYGMEPARIQGLRAEGTLGGTLEDPELAFRLRLDAFSYNLPLVAAFSAQGGYQSERGLHLTGKAQRLPVLREAAEAASIAGGLRNGIVECEIHAEPSLRLRGRIGLEEGNAELDVHARKLDLSFLSKQWPQPASLLSVTGKAGFQGNANRKETWKGEGVIDELVCSFPDLLIRSTRAIRVRVGDGLVRGEAALEANGRPVSVGGSYPLTSGGQIRVDAEALLALKDLQKTAQAFLPTLQDWEGQVRIRAKLHGTAAAPRLRAVAELPDGYFRLASVGEGAGGSGEEKAEDTKGRPPEENILEGSLRMSVNLDGPVERPGGNLKVDFTEGSVYGFRVDRVGLEASSRDGRTWHPRMDVRSGEASLSAEGQCEIPIGRIAGSIRSTDLDLAALFGSRGIPVQGFGRLEGTVEGTVRSPRIELRARARSLAVQGIPVGELDAELGYEKDRLSVSGRTGFGSLEAVIRLKEEAFSARGSLEGVPVGPILEAVPVHGVKGTATLSAEVAGPLRDLEGWQGEILLTEIDLRAGDYPVLLEGPVRVRFEGGSLILEDECVLQIAGSPVRIAGVIGEAGRLTLQGSLALEPFASLIPWFRFETARAEADLVIRGSLSSPLVDGSLRVRAGQVRLGGLGYPVDALEADLRAASNRISLDFLTARVADGRILGSGALNLSPLSFEDVALTLDSVPVRLSEGLRGRIQGNLVFRGNLEDALLSGRIRILEARYGEDFDVLGMVLRPSRPGQETVQSPDPFLKALRLDLRIQSGPELIVRNNMARVILSTDMEIRGTAAHPVPLGIVRVEEGRVMFSKKDFDITQGSLSFIDPQGGSPNLQLESMVKVQGMAREYTIYLTFAGPLDRIRLELSSVPDLEREDIMSLLVTGKTRDEFSASEKGDAEEAAQRMALSGITYLVGDDMKAATGLDTFAIERTEGRDMGVRTVVGKQFNERVELRGVFAVGSGQQVSEAQIGYLLTDTFRVVATQRTDGSFGLDFRIRIGSR
jgi:hypothetical protein